MTNITDDIVNFYKSLNVSITVLKSHQNLQLFWLPQAPQQSWEILKEHLVKQD